MGEPIFQVWGGEKRENQNFSKILGGIKALHIVSRYKRLKLVDEITMQTTNAFYLRFLIFYTDKTQT